MILFSFTNFADVFDEVYAYIEANKEAMKEYADGVLDIDWPSYKMAAESNQMMIVTIRHDFHIVGFSLFLISSDLRDKNKKEASNHGLYLEKEFRSKYGVRLIKDSDKFLSRLSISSTSYTNDSKVFGKLLTKLGYKATHTIWGKNHV